MQGQDAAREDERIVQWNADVYNRSFGTARSTMAGIQKAR